MSEPTDTSTTGFSRRGYLGAGVLVAVGGLCVIVGISFAPNFATIFWIAAPLAAITALIVLFSNRN